MHKSASARVGGSKQTGEVVSPKEGLLCIRSYALYPYVPLLVTIKERARTERQRTMSDSERIKLLEKALIRYIELYGFIDEAREYYIRNADGKVAVSEQKH